LAIGVVRSTQELAESEWAKEWGAVIEVNERANGVVRMPGPPWRFSRSTLPPPGIPAYQGEHNGEILVERNVAPEVIEDLRLRRVLLSRRTPRGAYD
jgi:crotonobetainyl-CoA:carnitine CoA-transferase CaiB-like acyl-CoA transferase